MVIYYSGTRKIIQILVLGLMLLLKQIPKNMDVALPLGNGRQLGEFLEHDKKKKNPRFP